MYEKKLADGSSITLHETIDEVECLGYSTIEYRIDAIKNYLCIHAETDLDSVQESEALGLFSDLFVFDAEVGTWWLDGDLTESDVVALVGNCYCSLIDLLPQDLPGGLYDALVASGLIQY